MIGKKIFGNPGQCDPEMQTPQRANFLPSNSLGRPYHQDAKHLEWMPDYTTPRVDRASHKTRHVPDGQPQESMRMAQVVILKRSHFFSIDNDIIDVHAKTIGAIGIAIYAVLARYANRRTGECWPAIARIQRTLNLGRSSVKRYLHRLEAAGLISIEARRSDDGDRTSNLYTLLDPEPAAIAQHQQTIAESTALPHTRVDGDEGRSTDDPPPVRDEREGRSTADQEPDLHNQKQETTPDSASPVKTKSQETCTHPAPDLSHIDGMTICFHCWTLLETHGLDDEQHTTLISPEELTATQAA
jgi:DNA-binding MarR family transcriptional regulator